MQPGRGRQLSRDHWWSWWYLGELLVIFAIGVALIQYLYSGSGPGTGRRANLVGNDGYYHVKMAALLPEIGLPDTFPWLRETIFNGQFVSHHYGFHAYLCPFVLLSKSLTGDYILGARWAMSVSFGLVLATAMLILMSERIRFRWLWLVLMLALPHDFYLRHAYVRAIDLSLLCMLVGMFFILRRRYWAAALTVAVYTHVYLGSFFLIIIAVIDFLSGLAAKRGARFDWRLAAWIAAGAAIGLITHPYFPDNIDFLRTQIFGSGLTPQISVGREWSAYKDVWRFANLIGVPLWAMGIAIALRMRRGTRLSRNEWTVLVSSFFFFALLLKAQRFVEYWPLFAILAAALVGGPIFGREGAAGTTATRGPGETRASFIPLIAWLACGAVFAGLTLVPIGERPLIQHTEHVAAWAPVWIGLAAAYLIVTVIAPRLATGRGDSSVRDRALAVATPAAFTAALLLFLLATLGPQYNRWRHPGRRNLEQIQPAMEALKDASNEGDIVFTDDWDVFPVYFYFNHWNRFLYGLDPVFGYRHDVEKWERFVKISRGEVPATVTIEETAEAEQAQRTIEVKLDDIRDVFGARFVVVDDDHERLAHLLDKREDFARRIYPKDVERGETPPLAVYRILESATKAQAGQQP
jgi:hypothetical protein